MTSSDCYDDFVRYVLSNLLEFLTPWIMSIWGEKKEKLKRMYIEYRLNFCGFAMIMECRYFSAVLIYAYNLFINTFNYYILLWKLILILNRS